VNNCLFCNGKDFVYAPYTPKFKLLADGARIKICMSCGAGVANPLPDSKAVDEYYESDAYQLWHKQQKKKPLDVLPHPRALSQYDTLATHFDFKNISSVLDFGAGSAVTTRTIKIRHPHVCTSVTELSKHLRAVLKECEEIDNVYRDIPSNLPPQDLIIVSGVIEHLLDPIASIKNFGDNLSKNGYLFIEVPHCPYPYYYIHKTHHNPHIFFFTKKSFEKIASLTNLELIWIDSMGMSIKEWCETKNVHEIVRRTGFSHVINEQGIFLRILLKKKRI